MSVPTPEQTRRRRQHAEQRARDRRVLLAVALFGLVAGTLAFALLAGIVRAMLAALPGRSEAALAPIERGCGPGEIVSLDSWLLARINREPVATPKKSLWEHAIGSGEALQEALRSQLQGWPSTLLIDPATLPSHEHLFAARLAYDTWRGLDALTDRTNGLPLDTVTFAPGGKGPPAAARIGDYTNITNIGLQLVNIVGAMELGLIDADGARERLTRLLDTLDTLETDEGFFFNYYDTTSLERTSHFVSFVDSAWLATGLMIVRMTFPELHERCTALLDRQHYGSMYDRGAGMIHHGYYIEPRAPSRFHYSVLYTEARLGALIAIGKRDIPEEAWFRMVRTFPSECRWQTQEPVGVRTVEIRGHRVTAGHYRWGSLRYVPSWGGSMFEALMPMLVLDELEYAPRSLGANGLAHAVAQARFARRRLGLSVWGMSPSARPGTDAYGEYGTRLLGSFGYPIGPVTPHAGALALSVIPKAAIANLQELARRYRLYGDFGLYDAVDATTGAVAYKYLALDQSMLFIALVNHLTDGVIQRRFAADPIMQNVLPMIGEERFFD